MVEGVSLLSSAISHDSAVSIVSAGLNTSILGVALNMAKCSIGWWVGPSSPNPILSCVITYITLIFISEESLIAPRA